MAAIFSGLKCAVLVLVVEALLRVAKRALKSNEPYALAIAAFLALFARAVPFPVVVLVTALVGIWRADTFHGSSHGTANAGPPTAIDALLANDPGRPAPLAARAHLADWITMALWLVPLGLLIVTHAGVLADVAMFFSKMSVVTFGGACAVLAYVTQQVVEDYNWLSTGRMLTRLGLAETTPGR